MNTISMMCKKCGAKLHIDEDRNVTFCPYCGSKEMIVESEYIKATKIKYDAYKDVEINKAKALMEMELKKKELDIRQKELDIRQKEIEYKRKQQGLSVKEDTHKDYSPASEKKKRTYWWILIFFIPQVMIPYYILKWIYKSIKKIFSN